MTITKNTQTKLLYGVIGLLAAIPIVVLLSFLWRYSVNVIWWDQLSLVDLMTKFHNGSLTIYDLWKQHNEHRILVPQTVELAIGWLTGFNLRAYVAMHFLLTLASFGFLLTWAKKTFKNNLTVAYLAIPFAWLLFSPIAYVNWIWGFQLAFYMCCFFTILTIWLLVKDKLLTSPKLFILTMVMAALTTYCNGNGLLIWPIGLAILLWRRTDRDKLMQWAGAGLVVAGSYLYKFRRSPDSPHLSQIIKEPVAVFKYAVGYLGRILSVTPTSARYIGTGLLVIMAVSTFVVYKKGKLNNIIVWLALASYVLLTALLAAVSRLNFGVNHSFISNSYPTISVFFIVATIAVTTYALSLSAKGLNRRNAQRLLPIVFVLGGFCFYVLTPFITNYGKGAENIKALGQHMQEVQTCTYTAQSPEDDCLMIIYPSKPEAWKAIQDLKALHWGDFKHGQ